MLKIKLFPVIIIKITMDGIDLLLKYSSGLTLKDKLSFFILKISYLGLRLTTSSCFRSRKKEKTYLSKIDFLI